QTSFLHCLITSIYKNFSILRRISVDTLVIVCTATRLFMSLTLTLPTSIHWRHGFIYQFTPFSPVKPSYQQPSHLVNLH
ncbi:hypothetical protein VIGAN_05019100, partial [Vigna angularis var. angularis]